MRTLWSPEEIANITGADIKNCPEITGISTDSRTVQVGDLYIPLIGERFDGHDYIQQALSKGAAAALSEKAFQGPVFVVPHTFYALEKLARAARNRAEARILAVTGSAGKTTTKEALNYVLSRQGKTWVTPKSYNNHWGVPISLAGLSKDADFAVLELGMNNPGEIQPLAEMVKPHVALITTILPVHIGRLGSLEAVAAAKAEVFKGLMPGGTAILNADDEHFESVLAKVESQKVVTFGKRKDADYRLISAEEEENQMLVHGEVYGKKIAYRLSFAGEHWPVMSLGWLAAVESIGGDVAQAAQDLAGFQLLAGRGEIIQIPTSDSKVILIDESYNANPDSMALALNRLKTYQDPCIRRRIAVLGDMGELGEHEQEAHRSLAQWIVGANIDVVYGVGALMKYLIEALPPTIQSKHTDCPEKLVNLLQQDVLPGDLYLVKGSRGGGERPRLQSIVDKIKATAQTAEKTRNTF